MSRRQFAVAVLLALATACQGPAADRAGPYTPLDSEARDTVRAQALSRAAADLIAADAPRAEKLLRDALSADLFYGPAHNNLGIVFLQAGKLYEAASEFEWARQLMPGHPDPRVNLALVLEAAGKFGAAGDAYESALEAHASYLPAIQGLARAAIRDGRDDSRLVGWLETISMEAEDEAWRAWAQGRLTKGR